MTNLNKRRRMFNRLKQRMGRVKMHRRGIEIIGSLLPTTSEAITTDSSHAVHNLHSYDEAYSTVSAEVSELARQKLEWRSSSTTSTISNTSTGYVGDEESASSSDQSQKLSPPQFPRSFSKGRSLSTTSSATSVSTSTRSSATHSVYGANATASYETFSDETLDDSELSKGGDERNDIVNDKSVSAVDGDVDDVRVVLSEIVAEVVVRQHQLSDLKERQSENELSHSEC